MEAGEEATAGAVASGAFIRRAAPGLWPLLHSGLGTSCPLCSSALIFTVVEHEEVGKELLRTPGVVVMGSRRIFYFPFCRLSVVGSGAPSCST